MSPTCRTAAVPAVLDLTRKGGKGRQWPLPVQLCELFDVVLDGRMSGPLLLDTNGERLDRHDVDRLLTRLGHRAHVLTCHGTYPPGPGPEIHDQTQLAQLIALGRTVAVFPDSARAWLWAEHTAVPLADAPPVVTHIAWPAHSRSLALAGLIRTATQL
jgi:DNA-binding transcriptional LysR family regulator